MMKTQKSFSHREKKNEMEDAYENEKLLPGLLCGMLFAGVSVLGVQAEEIEECTITFAYWGSGAEQAAIEASLETFQEAYPQITVNAMHIPEEDFLVKNNSMIAAGEPLDISYSASWKCQFGEEGLIYNFYDLAENDPDLNPDNYLDTCWWMWSEDESAGPIMANVTPSLMYNADLVSEAGIEVPTTTEDAWSWDEFVEVAKQLTLDGEGRNAGRIRILTPTTLFSTALCLLLPGILICLLFTLTESLPQRRRNRVRSVRRARGRGSSEFRGSD